MNATAESPSRDTIVTDDGGSYTAPEVAGTMPFEPGQKGSGETVKGVKVPDAEKSLKGLNGKFPSSVIGTDGRTQISTTTSYPYRAIAYLVVTFPNNQSYSCTGWFYGPSVVATAGHCVHDKNQGGYAKSIKVYPGRNGSSAPYGYTTKYKLKTVVGWRDYKDPNYDYGAIVTNAALGNTVGWFGYFWQTSNTYPDSYKVAGYPGDKPSATLWGMTGPFKHVMTSSLWYSIDTAGGQSGSPVYRNKSGCGYCSAGIHTYGVGRSPYTDHNSATRINKSVFNNMYNWKYSP